MTSGSDSLQSLHVFLACGSYPRRARCSVCRDDWHSSRPGASKENKKLAGADLLDLTQEERGAAFAGMTGILRGPAPQRRIKSWPELTYSAPLATRGAFLCSVGSGVEVMTGRRCGTALPGQLTLLLESRTAFRRLRSSLRRVSLDARTVKSVRHVRLVVRGAV